MCYNYFVDNFVEGNESNLFLFNWTKNLSEIDMDELHARLEAEDEDFEPAAMIPADIGMMNIPTVIDVSALYLLMARVTAPTVNTTTKGLTFAYHDGDAPSPAILSTYFGMVAYI